MAAPSTGKWVEEEAEEVEEPENLDKILKVALIGVFKKGFGSTGFYNSEKEKALAWYSLRTQRQRGGGQLRQLPRQPQQLRRSRLIC